MPIIHTSSNPTKKKNTATLSELGESLIQMTMLCGIKSGVNKL
jgi:spore coat protein CotF